MHALHQADPDALPTILSKGLKRTSRGKKDDDKAIKATDIFLDARRPSEYRDARISRDDNIYAYVSTGSNIIDIRDGMAWPTDDFLAQSEPSVLELAINPMRSYVSDLDIYDELKESLSKGASTKVCENLARQYWAALYRLDRFTLGVISRPEIMITYDIPSDNIQVLK